MEATGEAVDGTGLLSTNKVAASVDKSDVPVGNARGGAPRLQAERMKARTTKSNFLKGNLQGLVKII
jgi:hypothetical protein